MNIELIYEKGCLWSACFLILENKIKITEISYNICLWNDNYLFVGCSDKTIKLIELNNGLIVKSLTSHDKVLTVKRIIHPKFDECLISQNLDDNLIKI